jgi:hypothetical protein
MYLSKAYGDLSMVITTLVISLWAILALGSVICPQDSTADAAD